MDDLKKLNYDELKNYKLTKFEFWDYSKGTSDSTCNIAFRLYSSDGKKSNVTCSKYWLNSPEGYNSYLTSFSLEKVTKIEVYHGTDPSHAPNGPYVGCLVFYENNNIIGAPYAYSIVGSYNVGTI